MLVEIRDVLLAGCGGSRPYRGRFSGSTHGNHHGFTASTLHEEACVGIRHPRGVDPLGGEELVHRGTVLSDCLGTLAGGLTEDGGQGLGLLWGNWVSVLRLVEDVLYGKGVLICTEIQLRLTNHRGRTCVWLSFR